MTHTQGRAILAEPGRPTGPDRRFTGKPWPPRRDRGPSPEEGECIRRVTRGQIEDRLADLGDLVAKTSGGDPQVRKRARESFLSHLAADVRRPGFGMLVAETTGLTGCAYGFPVCGGRRWPALDAYLSGRQLPSGSRDRLLAIPATVVEARVRTQDQGRQWNLARRLQRRLLTDHDTTVGVTAVLRTDTETCEALRSWGWSPLAESRYGTYGSTRWHVLALVI